MEMIQISKDKLKVMMSESDMEGYELDCDKMDYDDLHTRLALRRILGEAKRVCGFDADCEHMFVQIFPSRSGGCEIFVTLLDGEDENKSVRRKCRAFVFDSIEMLLHACSTAAALGYEGESEAYSSEDDAVYLLLDDCGAVSVIAEYGMRYPVESFETLCGEHFTLIASPDAVHMLAGYDVR